MGKTFHAENPVKHRNPYAMEAKMSRGGPHKDRRTPRGGSRNETLEYLQDAEEEEKYLQDDDWSQEDEDWQWISDAMEEALKQEKEEPIYEDDEPPCDMVCEDCPVADCPRVLIQIQP